jgi:putative PEP-CTERM system TPR-repeat lipoprotein
MTKLPKAYRAALALALTTLLLVSCGRDSPEVLVASAKQYLEKKELRSAAIQLRNALQKMPENAEARFLLGSTLLDAGDPISAEKELRRALEYGYSPDAIYPLLARALLEQGATDKLVSELKDKRLRDPGAQAMLLGLEGDAYIRMRKPTEARAAFEAALQAKPDSPKGQLGQAWIKLMDRDLKSAAEITDKVLAGAPEFVDALMLKAELLTAQGDSAAAIKAYEKVIALQPSNISAYYGRVALLTRARQFDQASAALREMQKVAPRHPRTYFAQALLALAQGKPADAREPLEYILKVAPKHLPTLLLAGTAEYQLRSYTRALDYFRRALAQAPSQPYTRRMLTATYLRSGEPQEALKTFEPLLKTVNNDPQLLALAGEVYLSNNEPERAADYFQRAVAADPKGVEARTRLGQLRLVTGDVDRAIQDLEAASAADEHQIQADLVLIANYFRQREFDKALAAAQNLEKKQPDNPLAQNLLGAIYLAKRDSASARKKFEQALALRKDYAPALYNLARLDLAENKPDQAKRRYEAILAQQPNNEVALLGLADLLVATKAPESEVLVTLEKAVSGNPGSAQARIALIRFHLQRRDAQSALSAAEQAQAKLPDNLQIMELLGMAQQTSGDANQAIATFNKVVTAAPKSPQPLILLAGAQLAAKDVAAAKRSLRQALDLNPNLVQVRQQLAMLSLQQGKPDEALAEAKEVQKRFPKQPTGYLMEGDVEAAQKKWPTAATAYREALKLGDSTIAATRLHVALEQSGKAGEADAFARSWVKDNPKDTAFLLYLADRSLRGKHYKTASQLYKTVIGLEPRNAVALNNLAFVAEQLGDPDAIKYAEQALSIAPESPAIQDTLGWLLVEKGDVARGVDLLKKAAARAPNAADVRLHLAKALIKTGDRSGARDELEAIMKLDRQTAARAEAQRLLATL